MKKLLLTASLLSAPFSFAATPPIAPGNPLFSYALNDFGQIRNKFTIPYSAVAEYYQYTLGPTLTQNLAPSALHDRNGKPIKTSLQDLEFRVNLETMTITPDEKLDPEIMQNLFSFDVDQYIANSGEKDFVSAKYKEFRKMEFDPWTQHYDRSYLHLSDWRSLNHPPIKEITDYDKFMKDNRTIPENSKYLTAEFNREMDELSESELTRGNKMKLLVNGLSFEEKLRQVKAAKRSIYVGVMTFASDPSSFELIDALIEKKKEGLDVQVIIEELWTRLAFRKTMKKFINAGIKLVFADDMYTLNGHERTLFHNKIWVFDEERAIVGGQNIVNSANNATGFNHWNKEIDLLIEGPTATDVFGEYIKLKRRFDRPRSARRSAKFNLHEGRDAEEMEEILEARKENERKAGLRGAERYAEWFKSPASAREGLCRFVIQGPQKDRYDISKAYLRYFEEAKDQIYLVSHRIDFEMDDPYYPQWNTKFFDKVFDAADRGVNVKIITNGIDGGFAEIGQNIAAGNKTPRKERKNERRFARQIMQGKEPATFMKQLTDKLALKNTKDIRTYIDEAITHPNLNIWMHFQFIHSKTALIDNILTAIGSYNFEEYSAEHSHESAIFCLDEELAATYKKDQIRDIVNSTPVIRHEDRKEAESTN